MSQLSQQCRKLLYRMMWQTPDGIVDAFALCATREDARRFFSAAISLVSGIHQDELELFNLESFDDLVSSGVSEDEELRVFETQWNGAHVVGWTNRPLFLTPDPTLIARWADLRAELAAAQTNSAISRIQWAWDTELWKARRPKATQFGQPSETASSVVSLAEMVIARH